MDNDSSLLNAARAAQLRALAERIKAYPDAAKALGLTEDTLSKIFACRVDLFTDQEVKRLFVAVELAIHKLEK
jgi:hypothetical protein